MLDRICLKFAKKFYQKSINSSAIWYYYRFMLLRLLLFILLPLPSSYAQDLENGFVEGVAAYQAKDFEKALSFFQPLFEQYPNNPVILYNLGLVKYQQGELGLALGLWRKARIIDQSFSEVASAISFTEEQLFPDQEEESLTEVRKFTKGCDNRVDRCP